MKEVYLLYLYVMRPETIATVTTIKKPIDVRYKRSMSLLRDKLSTAMPTSRASSSIRFSKALMSCLITSMVKFSMSTKDGWATGYCSVS